MKTFRGFFALALLLLYGGIVSGQDPGMHILIEPLQPYVSQVIDELSEVPEERRRVLEEIAQDVSDRLLEGDPARLIYICTHNSRRSHMAQLWAQTAACYYGLDSVTTFSGGIETTECNIRTVAALRRAGFSVVSGLEKNNPVYLIQYSDEKPPMRAFSKIYNQGGNPTDDFIALMCCSLADMLCPVVDGASSRYAIHYVDPKDADDTDEEIPAYNSRCREIAHEMFYLMSSIHSFINE